MHSVVPFFQPIISASTAEVVGHETLARVRHADGSIGSAGELLFSPALSKSERLNTDRLIRRLALEKFAASGDHRGYLTLNISPEWIDYTEGSDPYTVNLIKDLGINPDNIVIELIETSANEDLLRRVIHSYKDFGLKVAIDDFGAGHSSFDRVISLHPDIIKLDMALFNKALQRGGKAEHLIDSICFLAERLGSKVLAEGVENLKGFSYSQKFGAELLQGYLFSPANAEFTKPHAFSQHIDKLRQEYVTIETAALAKKTIIRNVLDSQLLKLVGNTHYASDLNTASLSVLTHPDFFKLYICNTIGNQISNNFFYDNGKWLESAPESNTNLSCRPYFCQLQSALRFSEQPIVTCAPYHDLQSKQITETTACRLDDGNTLFIDVKHRR